MKRVQAVLLAFIAALCFLLGACSAPPSKEQQCRVVLSDSAFYTCEENIKTVARGEDVVFTLNFNRGYTFRSASYGDYSVNISAPDGAGKRVVQLTLNKVRYSSFVSIEAEYSNTFLVSVAPSSVFRCEEPDQLVTMGQDATFTLYFQADYTLASIDYPGSYHVSGIDSDVNENSERRVVLTVEKITKNTVITVKTRTALPPSGGDIELPVLPDYAVVGYVLNGGWFIDDEISGSYYTRNYPLLHHRQPNTSLGTDTITRYGYTLTGWNTRSDGNGEHIGLGSRAPVLKGESLLLYAEWAEWTDVSMFDYVLIDTEDVSLLSSEKKDKLQKLQELADSADSEERSAVITAYRGTDAERLVIPERLGGYPVEVVARNTVNTDKKIKTIVFPVSMKYVMEFSFLYCEALTELYLYDNMWNIDYNAFGTKNTIETLHINAKNPPIYGTNESAQLANKLEMLMEHENETKTVFFGSCSIWYSIHVETFGVSTNRLAFNMGVEGDTCTLMQLDLIKRYMHAGDTLMYICDLGSPYLLGYDVSFDLRSFRMVESNYDLLALLNMQRYNNVLAGLNEYLATKRLAISVGLTGTYDDYIDYVSEFGDMAFERVGTNNDGHYKFTTKATLEQSQALEKTKTLLQSFADMGIDIYYGFGLVSEICVLSQPSAQANLDELQQYYVEQFEKLNMPAVMVGSIHTSILPEYLFYDTTYRLTTEGTKIYTDRFIEYFKSVVRE